MRENAESRTDPRVLRGEVKVISSGEWGVIGGMGDHRRYSGLTVGAAPRRGVASTTPSRELSRGGVTNNQVRCAVDHDTQFCTSGTSVEVAEPA